MSFNQDAWCPTPTALSTSCPKGVSPWIVQGTGSQGKTALEPPVARGPTWLPWD